MFHSLLLVPLLVPLRALEKGVGLRLFVVAPQVGEGEYLPAEWRPVLLIASVVFDWQELPGFSMPLKRCQTRGSPPRLGLPVARVGRERCYYLCCALVACFNLIFYCIPTIINVFYEEFINSRWILG